MATTYLDTRQSIYRGILQELAPYATSTTLDVLLPSINADLTPPLKVDATSTPSLVVNVGPAIVANSESSRNKSISFINNTIPTFTSGTVTFPSTNGGTISTSTGQTFVLALPSNEYAQALLSLDTNGNLQVTMGTPNAVLASALVPTPLSNALPFAYVTLHNVAGTVANINQNAIFQFAGSGGSGGSGSGGLKNYFVVDNLNPNFESNNTSHWSLFNTTLTNLIPTGSITAGAASITTFATTNVNPLAGSYSLNAASSAAWAAGQGFISDAATIDNEDQSKVLGFSFYYEVESGAANANFSGTSSNTFAVYIYDVTNSAWIQPAGVYGMTQSSGGAGICTGSFQTSNNGTQYRVAVLAVNASAGAVSMYFDDFSFGPQLIAQGAVITDWQTYTSTIAYGSGTNTTTQNFFYRRVGDSLQLCGRIVFGTPSTWNDPTFSLPPGLSIDTTKTQATSNRAPLGTVLYVTNGNDYLGNAFAVSGTLFALSVNGTNGLRSTPSNTNPATFASGDFVDIVIDDVPIVGWSSNVSMSDSSDTRVVAMNAINAATTIGTTQTVLVNPTVVYDTHGGYNTSTGQYTVPVSGKYKVTGSFLAGAGATASITGVSVAISVRKNTVIQNTVALFEYQVSGVSLTPTASGSVQVDCIAGDVLDVAIQRSASIGSFTTAASSSNYLTIERLSGPSVLAASNSVAFTANGSTTTVGSGTTATIINPTIVMDNTGSYNVATGIFTAPISGTYQFTSGVLSNAPINGVVNDAIILNFVKNGTILYASRFVNQTTGTIRMNVTASSPPITMVAGDTMLISLQNALGSPFTNAGATSPAEVWFGGFRIGN